MKAVKREILVTPTERLARTFRGYVSSNYQRPIFDTHDVEFALKEGPAFDQTRSFNEALFVQIGMSFGGERGVYVAGSISKGMLANILVAEASRSRPDSFTHRFDDGTIVQAAHTSDIDETVGNPLFADRVLKPNRRIQIMTQGMFEPMFGDKPVLIPSMLQGATTVVGQAEFDRGTKRRDSAWMQVWTPAIRELIDTIPVFSDWFFSGATSGLEYPEAECVAAGLRPDQRPNADMRFVDLNGKDVPLSEILRRRAEYLVWTAEQGNFRVKHEATAFMRSAAIAEMAKRGELPNANPVFLAGILDNMSMIEAIRREMEPLILERIEARMFPFDTTDLRRVFPDFVDAVKDIRSGFNPNARLLHVPPSPHIADVRKNLAAAGIALHPYTPAELKAGDFFFQELATLDPTTYLDRTERNVVTRPARPIDEKGKAVLANDGRSLFSRRLLTTTNERERQQVSVMIGGLQTVSPRNGRSVYVVADTRPDSGELPLLQRFKDKKQPVRFSSSFADANTLLGQLPRFSLANGEPMPGPNAQLMIRHTAVAQDTTDFCFVTGKWETSDQGVQDVVLATRMQLGLEAASPIDPHFVRVYDERGHNLTLADRTRAIFESLKPELLKNPDSPNLQEQATAVAQLRALHRLSHDHVLRENVFKELRDADPHLSLPDDLKWERIPAEIFAYDHRAFDDYWHKEVRPVLEKHASLIIRPEHLDQIEDFRSVRDRQRATQAIAAAGKPPTQTIYRALG